jgi:hypothetical protein
MPLGHRFSLAAKRSLGTSCVRCLRPRLALQKVRVSLSAYGLFGGPASPSIAPTVPSQVRLFD